jgi:phosphoribosylanthranilate isomerase
MENHNIEMKVCGMRDRQNILDVSRLRPHYMGFIFYSASPRYVGEDFLMPDMPASTKKVGVFVNAPTTDILEKADRYGLDYIQLHGSESVEQCRELKQHGLGIIKVFSIDDNMDFQITAAYQDAVDYFLFDTKGKFYGGNARTFNWDLLRRYDQKVPFFLSGGITPDHIEGIRNLTGLNLRAIDVNSGVELEPAFKDLNKIKSIQTILKSKS